ncbi:MAG TPA: M14 family zinc carboxypeptidase [Mycobacteriales bacterium]|nr:M14 family zinc carboxypeptidase [Mycobacteriales bacterium]
MSDDILQRVQQVPEFRRFPGVDELVADFHRLAQAHPKLAGMSRIGTSRLGEPLWSLRIGDGAAHAIIFACVHPNEPIGELTAQHLATTLLTDAGLRQSLDYTWHIIPCIDPDGTRLNEAWFDGPFERGFYARRFYRPAPNEQVEWTFPFAYKKAYFDQVMPETLALMRLIDETKPAFLSSLHNGELGGVYYYLTRPSPELYPQLHAIPESLGLALDTGEPEMPYLENYAPAIFRMSRTRDQYDFVESLGLDPVAGTTGDSSTAYAEKYGTFGLVTEVPYWSHPDSDDQTPTGERYADVVRRRGEGLHDLGERLTAGLQAVIPDLSTHSPFRRASEAFVPMMLRAGEQDRGRAADPANDRPATVAERFGCADLVHCFRLRYGGMLLRTMAAELAVGNGTPTIRAEHAALESVSEGWCAEAAAQSAAEEIPIGKLVGVQYGAILAAAAHARALWTVT